MTSAPGPPGRASLAHAPDKIEAHVWVVSGVVIVGMIMSILDTTIVNVALNTLGRDLHNPISQVQWVVTGYLLALAAVIPVTGWAARRFGAKRVYLVSLVMFTAGSAACGLAGSLTALILFRVLQGVGGGMIMPVAQLIMAQVAGPRRMGRVMGIVSMPAMLAPRPLLDVRLYANRVFAGASMTTFGLGGALFGAMILVPLYYQQVRGQNVIDTGLLNGPQGIGALVAMPIAGRLTERLGGGRVTIAGVSVLVLSTIPLAFVGVHTSMLLISLLLVVRG